MNIDRFGVIGGNVGIVGDRAVVVHDVDVGARGESRGGVRDGAAVALGAVRLGRDRDGDRSVRVLSHHEVASAPRDWRLVLTLWRQRSRSFLSLLSASLFAGALVALNWSFASLLSAFLSCLLSSFLLLPVWIVWGGCRWLKENENNYKKSSLLFFCTSLAWFFFI